MARLSSQVEVETTTQVQAASRSEIYQLLASAFCFPTSETFETIKAGNIWDQLFSIIPDLPYTFSEVEIPAKNLGLKFEEFQSLYIGLFEVGKGAAPPCPLYEGHYGGVRTAIMAELLAFYHFFGLQLNQQGPRELPDHLSLELEFMHVLTFKEVMASREGKKLEPYLKVERDFLKRHLVEFIAAVGIRLSRDKALFFSDIASLAERFCHSDFTYVTGCLRS